MIFLPALQEDRQKVFKPSAPCIPTILSEKPLLSSKKLFYDAFLITHRMEDFSVPYHFSFFQICHAESFFLLRIRRPESYFQFGDFVSGFIYTHLKNKKKNIMLKNRMSGMGFEPMNFEVSNLKFDALDRSANLTVSD